MVSLTAMEENGEFYVAVFTATKIADTLIYWLKALVVKLSWSSGQYGSYTDLTGFNPRWLKGLKVDELPRNGPIACLCEIFLLLLLLANSHKNY